MRFDEYAISTGLKGILSILNFLKLTAPSKSTSSEPISISIPIETSETSETSEIILEKNTRSSFITQSNQWVRSPTSGISHSTIKLGQKVKKQEVLCIVKDPFGAGIDIPVVSPCEGKRS